MDEMKRKAEEMASKLGPDYTWWDYVSLSVIIFSQVAPLLPGIKGNIATVIGTIIDAELFNQDAANKMRDGILPFKTKSRPD